MTAIKLPSFVKKQPLALGCGFGCLVIVALIYVRSGTFAEAKATLADKTSEGEHLKENVTNSSGLDEQTAAMTQATQAIEARLVHADQLAINLQYFYKIESESQAKLTNLQQTAVVAAAKNSDKTAYANVGYAMTVQGNYSQVMDFLRRVENGEHFSHVSGLTLTHGGGTGIPGNAGNLSLNLNLELLGLP